MTAQPADAPLLVRKHLSFPPVGHREPWSAELRAVYEKLCDELVERCQYADGQHPSLTAEEFWDLLPKGHLLPAQNIPLLALLFHLADFLDALRFLLRPPQIERLWLQAANSDEALRVNLLSEERLARLKRVTTVDLSAFVVAPPPGWREVELYQGGFFVLSDDAQ